MAQRRAAVGSKSKHGRSGVTNGSRLFAFDVDERTATARRYRDVYAEVISDMGGDDACSEIVHQLARRFASLSILAETMEAKLTQGEEIDLTAHATIVGGLARIAQRLGIGRKARDISPSLGRFLADRKQREAAE